MTTRVPSINKVFGIGSQKTGTTTLGHCLQTLGFTPHVLRPQSKVLRAYARDPDTALRYAERYRSFQDAPWSYDDFYQRLDRRFPQSKFILTERDVDRWFASFVKYKKAPGRERSDIRYRFRDPRVGVLMHKLAWGIDYDRLGNYAMEPHEATYRAVYERRNAGIRRYFEDRPQDLLVVDWEKGHGWAELSDFLSVDVPDLPFPHANVGTKHPPFLQRLLARGMRGALSITRHLRLVR